MNSASLTSSQPAFSQATSEVFFPMAGAALLILLLFGAAVLVIWARSRSGASWRAPKSASPPVFGIAAEPPQRLSSLRLDAAHRLYVVAWDNRQFLIATGVNVPPLLVATASPAAAVPSSPLPTDSKPMHGQY